MNSRDDRVSPFEGDILICAPHMDDETLGCGMLIALHSAKNRVRVLFAADGAGSPDPPAGKPELASSLPKVREAEARQALEVLGVDPSDIEFLGLPDGSLNRYSAELGRIVIDRLRSSRTHHVLIPFRYDRHPDHLAMSRAITAACAEADVGARVTEYFVYTQWRLLGTGDVRDYLPAEDVVSLRSEEAAERKRAALRCYRSQTTTYFEGQRRPILTEELIGRVCEEREVFLRQRPDRAGRRGLARARFWVPLACQLEPVLKRWKDRLTGERVQ